MSFGNLSAVALQLVLFGIILTVGLVVLAQNHTQIEELTSNTSYAYNASLDAQGGLADMSSWISLIVTVAMAGIVIGLILLFGGRATRG